MSAGLNIVLIVGVIAGLYYMQKHGMIHLPLGDALVEATDSVLPGWSDDSTNEFDQGSILTVAYPGYQNPPTTSESAFTDGPETTDSDDSPNLSRPGDALPAPVNFEPISFDAQPLSKIYGDAFKDAVAKTAASAQRDGPPKMPLPMVADTKSAAPLGALGPAYNVSAATPDMMKSTCRSACADKKTKALTDGCIASCQSKSLGLSVTSYNNAVDFLRPQLPTIPSSGQMENTYY